MDKSKINAAENVRVALVLGALLLATCAGNRVDTLESGNRESLDRRTSEPATNGVAPPSSSDAAMIMTKVAEKYSTLESFSSNGTSERTTKFQDDEKTRRGEEFRVNYERGRSVVIRWSSEEKENVFNIRGTKAWLESGGLPTTKYDSPSQGIQMVTLAEDGLSRFLFSGFVFQQELGLKNRYFGGLQDPQIIGETDVDGHPCHLLRGTFQPREVSMTYCIDKESFVVRSIERVIVVRKTVDDKEYVTTTRIVEKYSNIESK